MDGVEPSVNSNAIDNAAGARFAVDRHLTVLIAERRGQLDNVARPASAECEGRQRHKYGRDAVTAKI